MEAILIRLMACTRALILWNRQSSMGSQMEAPGTDVWWYVDDVINR
jgi:hypothetical protein